MLKGGRARLSAHAPHNPPARLLDKYKKEGRTIPIAKYYAMCDWFDETCGQLVDYLEKKKVRDDTLIVYVTDNGWIQRPDRNGYAPRSKQTPYEGGIRTPIMYSWPNAGLKPADRKELVSSIDIVPTILGAAGARIPDDLPGLNLLDNLKSGKAIERKGIFGESFAHDIADIEKPEASLLFRWRIEGKWKLLLTYDGPGHIYSIVDAIQPAIEEVKDMDGRGWQLKSPRLQIGTARKSCRNVECARFLC